jgi:hypothetical protein
MFFIWPFGLLGFLPSYMLWCAVGLALYVWAAIAGGVDRKYWLFLAVAPAVTVNVFLGQNGFLTAALLIGGLANLDRRSIVASAFVNARLVGLPDNCAWVIQGVVSACAFGAVVWTFWRKRDPVLSQALYVTATFLFLPWIMNYDMVVFGWIVALLRQRGSETFVDQCLSLALWMLPILMFPLGFAHIPGALLILPLFTARLLWRLAHGTSEQASSAAFSRRSRDDGRRRTGPAPRGEVPASH